MGKRWEPGHSFADTAGLVPLTLLLHCVRESESKKLIPTVNATDEERKEIRAYNKALGTVRTFVMPTSSQNLRMADYGDVMLALVNAQALSVKGKSFQATILLQRAIGSGLIGKDPLASVIAADLVITDRGDYLWAKKQLKIAAESHPTNKWLWLCYASKSELGSTPTGKQFDPLASPFTYEDSVIARKYILKMWPDHYKSLHRLAQDLDFLGRKAEAMEVLKRFEAVKLSDHELIQERTWLRNYFNQGGFKRTP